MFPSSKPAFSQSQAIAEGEGRGGGRERGKEGRSLNRVSNCRKGGVWCRGGVSPHQNRQKRQNRQNRQKCADVPFSLGPLSAVIGGGKKPSQPPKTVKHTPPQWYTLPPSLQHFESSSRPCMRRLGKDLTPYRMGNIATLNRGKHTYPLSFNYCGVQK